MFDKIKQQMQMFKQAGDMMKDESVRALLMHPKFQELMKDKDFQKIAQQQDMMKLATHPKFQQLMRDPEMMQMLAKAQSSMSKKKE